MMNNIKVRLLMILVIALISGVMTGCSKKESIVETQKQEKDMTVQETAQDTAKEETDKEYSGLVIHVGDLSAYELIKAADEKGFFKEEFEKDGITVDIANFQSGPPELEALTAGDLDFALMGDQPAVQGIANDIGIQIISGLLDGTKGNGLIAREDSGINDVADIKAKKIGVPVGTTAHQLLIKMLDANNLSTDDIELINLPAGDTVTALQSGDIQAAVTFEPSISKAVAAGGVKKISDAEGYKKIINVIVARNKFTEEYPELTVRFLKVIKNTAEWREENKEESINIVAERTGVNSDDIRGALELMNPLLALGEEERSAILETAKYLKENELIFDELTEEKAFNDTYAEEAGIYQEGK